MQLGCCHGTSRCLLCNPAKPATPELVAALVEHYRARGTDDEAELEVRFFGGPPPSDTLLDAVGAQPFSVRVRPDLLTRADAGRLIARGVRSIELDALTFHHAALKAVGRSYRSGLIEEISQGLASMGVSVGGVLAPGLPDSSHETSVDDARKASRVWSFVRLHPVLVLARAGLRARLETHRYTPLDLAQAVTVCRDMMDVLEGQGVAVVRVGQRPGADELGRVVAGPNHGGLRELVEARRTLETLRTQLAECVVWSTRRVRIRCAPADETRTRGPLNVHIRSLRSEFELEEVTISPDPTLTRGQFRVEPSLETP